MELTMNLVGFVLFSLLPGQDQSVDPGFPRDVEAACLAATVRILNPSKKTEGSGAIVHQSGKTVHILTAAHLAEKAERLVVHTFTAASYPKAAKVYESAQVIARGKDGKDLALIRLTTDDPVPGVLRICPPEAVPTEKVLSVLVGGCARGKAPTCETDRVTKKTVRKQPGGETALFWESTEPPTQGRSGGPLVDRSGRLIGVCSGKGDQKGYYCHIEEIHNFLKENGFNTFYQKPSP
jgi:S1-C subfamily serine protease